MKKAKQANRERFRIEAREPGTAPVRYARKRLPTIGKRLEFGLATQERLRK